MNVHWKTLSRMAGFLVGALVGYGILVGFDRHPPRWIGLVVGTVVLVLGIATMWMQGHPKAETLNVAVPTFCGMIVGLSGHGVLWYAPAIATAVAIIVVIVAWQRWRRKEVKL